MPKKKRSIRAKRRIKSKPKVRRKKKSTRKRVSVKRKTARKKKPVRRARRRLGKRVVKQVERRSSEKVIAGRRRKHLARKRKVVMAGSRRKRKVGAIGGTGLLIGLGIGAAALYLLTRKPATTTPGGTYTLPPIAQTNNYTRNTQSSDLVNYAIAGGLAIDAIIKLIDRLNSSTDQEVENIYDRVNTTGDLSAYV